MTEPSPSRFPVGIEPEYTWKTKRLHELVLATGRYIDAGWDVDFAWFLEMRELIGDLTHGLSNKDMLSHDHQQQQQEES